MTPQDQRLKAIHNAFKLNNFTVAGLRKKLRLGVKDLFYGAAMEKALSSLASQGLLKRRNATTYQCTSLGASRMTKKAKVTPVKAPSATAFLEELQAALMTSQKKQLPMGRTLSPHAEKSTIDLARYGEIIIPSEAPVKPLSSRKVPSSKEEALHYFELNFSEDADTTVKELAKLVLDQKIKLEAQERVLRSMYELLRNHVYHGH